MKLLRFLIPFIAAALLPIGASAASANGGGSINTGSVNPPVTSLIAGTGISLSPSSGIGAVTVTATGSGSGTVTSVSVVTANGVSGSVATATTTPAISITLGAITPSSVAATGRITATSGATLPGLNPGSYAGDPGTLVNGDIWYNSTSNALKAYINGSAVSLGSGGGVTTTGSPLNTYLTYFTAAGTISGNSGATEDTSGNVLVKSLGLGAAAASGTSGSIAMGSTTSSSAGLQWSDFSFYRSNTKTLNLESDSNALSFYNLLNTTSGTGAGFAFQVGQGDSQFGSMLYLNSSFSSSGVEKPNTFLVYGYGNSGGFVIGNAGTAYPITFINGGVTTGNVQMQISAAGGLSLGNGNIATDPGAGNFLCSGITMGSGTGTVTATSGVFSVTSDKRAKNPHGDFTAGLSAVLALHPVTYDFKKDAKHLERAGFYTQDVEPVIPSAVFHDSPDGMGSLDERPILAATVNAIKELASRPGAVEIRFFEALALIGFALAIRANARRV